MSLSSFVSSGFRCRHSCDPPAVSPQSRRAGAEECEIPRHQGSKRSRAKEARFLCRLKVVPCFLNWIYSELTSCLVHWPIATKALPKNEPMRAAMCDDRECAALSSVRSSDGTKRPRRNLLGQELSGARPCMILSGDASAIPPDPGCKSPYLFSPCCRGDAPQGMYYVCENANGRGETWVYPVAVASTVQRRRRKCHFLHICTPEKRCPFWAAGSSSG